MQSIKLQCWVLLNHQSSNSVIRSFLTSSFSTLSLSPQGQRHTKEITFLINYLNANFKFPNSKSIYISKHLSKLSSPQKPLAVLNFFKQKGFSENQIQSVIRQRVQILFSDADKTLKPKIEFFEQLGFQGPDLAKLISKNPTILTCSLERSLVPSVEAIRKIASNNEKDLLQILSKCGWVLPKYQLFMSNIAFLDSVGIVGSQLQIVLKRLPRFLISRQANVRNKVSRAVDMGFNENSRMLVHALHTICGLSPKRFREKLDLIQGLGFSEDESLQMFKKCPALLRTSEKKLRLGIEFYLHTLMLPKSVLIHQPMILMYSIEDRVLPRYRVYQLLKSEKLCKKLPNFHCMLNYSEEVFLNKYISRFIENAEALLIAYKGHYLEA